MNRYPVQPKVASTALGDMEYDITPGDAPTVLSVHAGLGGVDQARLIAEWVPHQFRILSASRPGYLRTPLSTGRTVIEQADAFVALLDSLRIDEVSLLSLSAGGPIAYSLAARHPDRVRCLIAIASVSGYYDKPDTVGPVGEALFMSNVGQQVTRVFMERQTRRFVSMSLAGVGHLPRDKHLEYVEHVVNSSERLAFLKSVVGTMYPYSQRKSGNINDIHQFKTMDELPFGDITCPALIIHGTLDADVSFYDGVRAYEAIEGATKYWIEDGDHLAFWLSPEAHKVQDFAVNFLSSARKSGRVRPV